MSTFTKTITFRDFTQKIQQTHDSNGIVIGSYTHWFPSEDGNYCEGNGICSVKVERIDEITVMINVVHEEKFQTSVWSVNVHIFPGQRVTYSGRMSADGLCFLDKYGESYLSVGEILNLVFWQRQLETNEQPVSAR